MIKKLLVITGATSSGKTYIESLANSQFGALHLQTATTREQRPDDAEGYYRYLNEPTFWYDIKQDAFIEHARYGANLYGTPKRSLEDALDSDNPYYTLVIDQQGAESIGKYLADNFTMYKDRLEVCCLVLHADKQVLLERLIKRSLLAHIASPDRIDKITTDTIYRIDDIGSFYAEDVHARINHYMNKGEMAYSDLCLLDNSDSNTDAILSKLQTFFAE